MLNKNVKYVTQLVFTGEVPEILVEKWGWFHHQSIVQKEGRAWRDDELAHSPVSGVAIH